jgi:hypothetical protein
MLEKYEKTHRFRCRCKAEQISTNCTALAANVALSNAGWRIYRMRRQPI